MPLGLKFSWAGNGLVNAVPVAKNTYPAWQAVIVSMMLFPWFPGLGRKLYALWRAAGLIFSSDFTRASAIVETIARTPGTNKKQNWGEIGMYMGRQPGVGENVYRHLMAARAWGPEIPYTRERRNATLELAWLAYKKPAPKYILKRARG